MLDDPVLSSHAILLDRDSIAACKWCAIQHLASDACLDVIRLDAGTRNAVVGDPIGSAVIEQGQRWMTRQPGYRQYWDQWAASTYAGDFKEYIDGLIREGEAAE